MHAKPDLTSHSVCVCVIQIIVSATSQEAWRIAYFDEKIKVFSSLFMTLANDDYDKSNVSPQLDEYLFGRLLHVHHFHMAPVMQLMKHIPQMAGEKY